MVARLEVELGERAHLADHLGVIVGEPVRRALVRHVRGLGQQVGQLGLRRFELRLQLFELGGHRAHLVDQLLLLVPLGAADRLRGAVLLGAELVHLRREVPTAFVGGQERVDRVGQVPPGEPLAERIGVVSDRFDIEHLGHLHLLRLLGRGLVGRGRGLRRPGLSRRTTSRPRPRP